MIHARNQYSKCNSMNIDVGVFIPIAAAAKAMATFPAKELSFAKKSGVSGLESAVSAPLGPRSALRSAIVDQAYGRIRS